VRGLPGLRILEVRMMPQGDCGAFDPGLRRTLSGRSGRGFRNDEQKTGSEKTGFFSSASREKHMV